jgi:hypothetical protein
MFFKNNLKENLRDGLLYTKIRKTLKFRPIYIILKSYLRTELGNLTNVEVVDYYTVHKGTPYFIEYLANVKSFQKYLPQFEQMVRTFKFLE